MLIVFSDCIYKKYLSSLGKVHLIILSSYLVLKLKINIVFLVKIYSQFNNLGYLKNQYDLLVLILRYKIKTFLRNRFLTIDQGLL